MVKLDWKLTEIQEEDKRIGILKTKYLGKILEIEAKLISPLQTEIKCFVIEYDAEKKKNIAIDYSKGMVVDYKSNLSKRVSMAVYKKAKELELIAEGKDL